MKRTIFGLSVALMVMTAQFPCEAAPLEKASPTQSKPSYGSCKTFVEGQLQSCTNYIGSAFKGDPAYIKGKQEDCANLTKQFSGPKVASMKMTAEWSSAACPLTGANQKCLYKQAVMGMDFANEEYSYPRISGKLESGVQVCAEGGIKTSF